MSDSRNRTAYGLAASLLIAPVFAGCLGGGSDSPIVAFDASTQTLEEVSVSGTIAADGSTRHPITFSIVALPGHGAVTLEPGTGSYTYTPDSDFYGTDSFRFRASQGKQVSNVATVQIDVTNVSDPPAIAPIGEYVNQPESLQVVVPVYVSDPDPDPASLSWDVVVADSSIASAEILQSGDAVALTPLAHGTTDVTIRADDGEFQVTRTFEFEVRDVTRNLVVTSDQPAVSAIVIENHTTQNIDFTLAHNQARTFSTVGAMVQHVHDLPEAFPGERFARKLWRFIRDTTYHDVPFNAERWLYDPWPTIQSLGWGFCGHVAGTYVKIARAAGYEARVWGLNGHVVPEILVDGAWQMFDPDVAVYYKKRDGSIAGVADLVEDSSLISDPFEPIFGDFSAFNYVNPYSQFVADIYATAEDNFTGNTFISPLEYPENRIDLPPGGKLTYPGRWSGEVTGVDGDVPYVVRDYRQALIEVPDTWSGRLTLPWMLWEILGSGTVIVDGMAFEVGSEALISRIRETTGPIAEIEIVNGRDLRLAMFINATQFHLEPSVELSLTGHAVGGLDVRTAELTPEHAAGERMGDELRKPVALLH